MNLFSAAQKDLLLCATFVCLLAAPQLQAAAGPRRQAAAPAPAPAIRANERDLIAVLTSSAEPGEKAIACKKLAIYGSDAAVPALAALLPDKDLSSWARIALEAIPGPVATKALRDALPKLEGRLLVGVINSLAVHRDTDAVSPLIRRLADSDLAVASAAAEALGRIGGEQATEALQKVVAKGPPSLRGPAALGCMLSADQSLAAGKMSQARKVYDEIRLADVPRQRVLEATRGAILARGDAGVPLLRELLRSTQKDMFAVGLSTARELPGQKATAAVAAEIPRTDISRSPLLLLALADRTDPSRVPAIFDAARTGPKALRLVAFGILERVGGVSSIPVLLAAAAEDDAEIAQAAKASLISLQDNAADGDLQERLARSTGRQRQILIQVAAQRHIDAALPEILPGLHDSDPNIRKAAVQAVGALGGEKQLDELVSLAQGAGSAGDRDAVATALQAIAARSGATAAPALLKLTGNPRAEVRITALHTLASAGGPQALYAVTKLANDPDEAVQDEAVRTLASWPNTWPEDSNIVEPLLTLSRTGKKPSHQVLALRAYLEYIRSDKKLKPQERLARLNDVLPLIQRPEEKRLAISVATDSAASGALPILSQFAADAAIADDACSAILTVTAKKASGLTKEEQRKALQLILDGSASDDLKKKAQDRLKNI